MILEHSNFKKHPLGLILFMGTWFLGVFNGNYLQRLVYRDGMLVRVIIKPTSLASYWELVMMTPSEFYVCHSCFTA